MRLLIVDDEELTRSGIISSLDWESLGISEIYQADDGANGLTAALEHRPDIILCDVRMPRMDGIMMLERLTAHLPDVVTIFMSGYSDKAYLKAAIKLNVVRYVEKPLDLAEIQAAIRYAVERCEQLARQRNAETIHTNLAATQLAYHLTMPYQSCKDAVDDLCAQFHERYGMDKFKSLTTFIVKLEHATENPADLPYIHQMFRQFLAPMHLHVIYSEKRVYYIIFHVYGSLAPASSTLSRIASHLSLLFAPFGNHCIAVGDTVSGISNAYHSYESAVILLQSSFFFAPGTVLTTERLQTCASPNQNTLAGIADAYEKALAEKNESSALSALNRMESLCVCASGLMPNQVKTIYYDLFLALYQNRRSQKLLPDLSIENRENIMDVMDSCFYFAQLHQLLLAKTQAFFTDSKHAEPENATIYLIRDYINRHYKESSLSVKDISDCAHLSASYVCTFFKNETGSTLNQYITEFRMEKAKQLLADPRYRITDISTAVGYSDSNYFGKSFRKYTGLSPSEYREKVLKS
ncbi:MAG: response regulator [Faecalimonas sp.]|nr:response regulator [Faecalimonas sp.]